MSVNADFIKAPLVVWLQSYLEAPITSNTQLSNGNAMAHVLKMIDQMVFSSLRIQHNPLSDPTTRAQNIVEILHGIKRFYQEKLQQLIVMKMPDILTVAKEPETELARAEMNTILLLILGCAVQCDRKEEFIEHIKELHVEVQRGLVGSIQEVTDNPENVIPYRISELADMNQTDLMTLSESLYHQLLKVLEQTDEYVDTIIDLALLHVGEEKDDIVEEAPRFRSRHPLSPRTSFRSTNILQANRQRMQTLQNDLDERNHYINDVKEELEQMKMQLDNVRMENKELVNEAAWAKSYRDEIDILKLEVERNGKIQAENNKLKEKARDMDFYKKRYEEIKEQSDLLYETKMVLEEKVAGSSSKINNLNRLQEENNRLYSQVKVLTEEREEDRRRIHDLVNEVAKLTMEKQESLSAYSMMNAELDGLRLQKDGDGLGIPLLVEYNQSTDSIRLEKENKHLIELLDQIKNTTPDSRARQLEEENRALSDSMFEYKTMIAKLTKALLNIEASMLKTPKLKSLLLEKDSNRQLTDVLGSQTDNIKNLQGTLTKRSSELDQATVELENLTKELAGRGVLIDAKTLKEALQMGNSTNGIPNVQRSTTHDESVKTMSDLVLQKRVEETDNMNKQLNVDLSQKVEELQSIQRRVKEVETHGKKVEEQLELREKDISNLERKMEQKVTENKTLQQNALIQGDKVSALEERISHLLSSANEDTRKVNKSLEVKLQRISELETKMLQFDELEKENEKIDGLLKLKEEKTSQLQVELKQYEEKHRDMEVQFEKTRNVCAKLEHSVRLKDEKITSLESSVDELTTSANSKQSERIELLMKSLDNRGNDINELEKKIEELIDVNSKLKTSNRSKLERIEVLEESLSELAGQLEGRGQRVIDERVQVLNKKLTEREGAIDELEVKCEDVSNQLNKSKRSNAQRDEKLLLLEQKLQDMDEVSHQKERLTKLLDDRSKKILDLEMQLDTLQNEKTKLERTIAQKESEYNAATRSLGTLEASITDQSSLSKLIEIKDAKISGLQSAIDDKDESIVHLENRLSDSEGKLKKLKHTVKLREDKIVDLEQSVDKLEELESKNNKLQSTIQHKDVKICELEDRLDQMSELSRTNARLKENNESKEEKINSLEQRIDDLEDAVKMNERLNQQVKQKEERITSLQERIEDLETRLHNAEQLRDQVKKNAEKEIIKLSEQNQELSEVKVKRQMSIMRREKKIVNLESRLNEYASEKEEKESKIQNLQSKLEGTRSKYRKLDMSSEEKDQKLGELEARLNELQDTYKEHQKLLNEYKKQELELTNLKQLVDSRDLNNNKYTEQLTSKEQAVRELQENLENTLALNNRLDGSIKKHEEKIRQLEKNLQETETSLEKCSTEINAKDRIIERNKVKLVELQDQLAFKEKELIELDKRLVVLGASENEKERLLKLVKEKETVVNQLENKIILLQNNEQDVVLREKEEMLEIMQKKINDAMSEKHKMKLNFQEKEGMVSDLERRIEELEFIASDSDKLSSIVKEKNNQISILRKSLDEYQTNATQLETKIDELMSEHSRHVSSAKQKDERLQSVKMQLEEHMNKNHSLNSELNMKEERMKSLKKSLEEMTQRNKDLEEDINMLEKDFEELKKTGSLKNITSITNKIQLTKRARTELHIQRGPPKKTLEKGHQLEIKMTPDNSEEMNQSIEENERLSEENECLEKQKEYLSSQLDEMAAENASLLTKNETLRSDFKLLKVDYEAVQSEMNEAREHFQELDVSATKIAHRCEVLVQLNSTLEEENKALMDQVNKLLSQNQDLLITTLQSREQYLDDERTFSDHIYGLEREKEKLSEKVMIVERALQDSGHKKKGNLWKGLLKKAGIKKKKGYSPSSTPSSTPSPDEVVPDFSPQSTPVKAAYVYTTDDAQASPAIGPIRGLLTRSRPDVSRSGDSSESTVRHSSVLDYSRSTKSEKISNWTNRPVSAFMSVDVADSSNLKRRSLHRPRSMEDISTGTYDQPDGPGPDEDCDIVPISRDKSSRSNNRKLVSSTPSSRITSPTNSNGISTPIQKVRVRTITTAEIQKASPDPFIVSELLRENENESPRSSLKMRSNTVDSPRNVILTSRSERSSVSGSSEVGRAFSEGDSMAEKFDNFYEELDLAPIRSSSEVKSPTRSIGRSESFSPVSTSSVNPFGSREQRASIRRYEMERMEMRKLPENVDSETDLSSPRTDPTPPPIPAKQPGTPIEKLLANQNFGTREQRGSLRKVQRRQSNTTPTLASDEAENSPSLQRQGAVIRRDDEEPVSPIMMKRQGGAIRKDSDSNSTNTGLSPFRRQEAIRRSSNRGQNRNQQQQPPPPEQQKQEPPKADPTWYEYGSV